MSEIIIDKNSIQNAILKDGQIVSGVISGNNSSINSSGSAAVAIGYADTSCCSIKATNFAAVAIGGAEGKGNEKKLIEANGQCSFAGGKIFNTGKISAKETGSFVHGQAANGGILNASGLGSFVHGQADTNSKIQTYKNGAHAEGYAENSGIIDASGIGSYAGGCASTGVIKASGNGAHAEGCAENGTIDASGNGANAEGCAINSSIYTSGDGAYAKGCIKGASSYICADGDGAHAEGYISDSNAYIKAKGIGAHAEGCIALGFNYGYIIAEGNGAHAEGILTQAKANGAHAEGIATIAACVGMTAVGKCNNIGKNNTDNVLFVVGNGQITGGTLSRSDAFWVKTDGTVHSFGGFYDESDIRKKDILSTISLEKSYKLLDKCQEIIYTLKEDPNKKEQLGMIAQEVEEFFPEIISTDSEGFKSLDYARLSVICLRLIKDIVEQVKELKNEIKNING